MVFIDKPTSGRLPTPPSFHAGERMSARKLNRFSEIERARRSYPAPTQTRYAGEPAAFAGVAIRAFVITALSATTDMTSDDAIEARAFSDDLGQDAVRVIIAKPWNLRRTPFEGPTPHGGITYTYASGMLRRAGVGPETELQVVIPVYHTGDVIYAVRLASKEIGVPRTTADHPDGLSIRWLDMNNGARAWARRSDQDS